MRTHQTKENTSHGYNQSHQTQSHKHYQSISDENKPPPAKIPNTKASPSHSTKAVFIPTSKNQTSTSITTSAKPSFVIHQDVLSPQENQPATKSVFSFGGKNVQNTFKDSSNGQSLTGDLNNPNIDQIISHTSAAEFRNSCNDSIRSTSSPTTDVYERDSEVFNLLHQNNEMLEKEAPMEDDTTLQEISGASEEELEEIAKPPQPVPESVLVSDEYSADILAHVKRTEVRNHMKY